MSNCAQNNCEEQCPDTSNPCYDNCGCLNPTTFECISSPGDHESLGVTDDMNGKEVLAALNDKFEIADNNLGKVKVDEEDVCPEYLIDKLEAGLNISLEIEGEGCDRKIVINASEGGEPVDVNVKVSSNDTTKGYLNSKIVTGQYLTKDINNPAGNEELELDVNVEALVSTDAGNMLTTGTDGGLKTSYTEPDGSETKVVEGSGVTVTGSGTESDPYVVSINPSIVAARPCFDGIWRDVTMVATGNSNVTHVSGTPKYRYRFDGSIEFRGSATYQAAFGTYSSGNRRFQVSLGTIPTTCVDGTEQSGTADLKGVNYIDAPQASADQIVQQYGYIIRKTNNNILLELQSSFTNATTKTIVVNFDGAISHPNL